MPLLLTEWVNERVSEWVFLFQISCPFLRAFLTHEEKRTKFKQVSWWTWTWDTIKVSDFLSRGRGTNFKQVKKFYFNNFWPFFCCAKQDFQDNNSENNGSQIFSGRPPSVGRVNFAVSEEKRNVPLVRSFLPFFLPLSSLPSSFRHEEKDKTKLKGRKVEKAFLWIEACH